MGLINDFNDKSAKGFFLSSAVNMVEGFQYFDEEFIDSVLRMMSDRDIDGLKSMERDLLTNEA